MHVSTSTHVPYHHTLCQYTTLGIDILACLLDILSLAAIRKLHAFNYRAKCISDNVAIGYHGVPVEAQVYRMPHN